MDVGMGLRWEEGQERKKMNKMDTIKMVCNLLLENLGSFNMVSIFFFYKE